MAKEKTAAALEARVLHDHDGHKANDVVTGKDAERAAAEGWGDPHPDAVAYAKSLVTGEEFVPLTPAEKRAKLAEEPAEDAAENE